MMIPGKFTFQKRRIIMEVLRITQYTRIWCVGIATRSSILELIVGLERRNNQMLMSLNWLKEMKISVTFYLLQTDWSVKKIDGLLTLNVHIISIPIGRCSRHTLQFKGEKSS